MTGPHEPRDDSDDNDAAIDEEQASTAHAGAGDGAEGGMGSSSDWVGHTGPGQVGTDGVRDTSLVEPPDGGPPEQSPGGHEPQPEGVEPKAGYPRLDPRSEREPEDG